MDELEKKSSAELWAEFILLELGMFWNIYSNIDKKISLFLCVCVALLYSLL